MTVDERRALELWISEAIEPKPEIDDACLGDESPSGAWVVEWVKGQGVGISVLDAIPQAWTTDETASAMLLEMMAAVGDGIRLEMWYGANGGKLNVWIQDRNLTTPVLYVKAEDRKTAIALAFKAWKESVK